jgi:hypothetical protein
LLVACASAQDTGEHPARSHAPFTSAAATLLDFELDGHLEAETDKLGAVRALIEAQLLFTIGQLNGERSVGQLGQLELSDIRATLIPPAEPKDAGPAAGGGDLDGAGLDGGAPADAGPSPPPFPLAPRYAVTYHARLPVAWGGATQPSRYTFKLPARLEAQDQVAFASKYGVTCSDPADGAEGAGHMFVVYRPQRPNCRIDDDDLATFDATVTSSNGNTGGKYPEYHRLWADGALRVVAVFTREQTSVVPDDAGASAFDQFLGQAELYLRALQPDSMRRSTPPAYSTSGAKRAKLTAELKSGRAIRIDVALVGSALSAEGRDFDTWYDDLTPTADVVLFNGHAGLGSNIRSLMGKGRFSPRHYLIWFANGCDTFAYVDRTLADRRALVNPDDLDGTKYMDSVTNVMAGFFGVLGDTSMTLVRALAEVDDPSIPPKTYEQILSTVDPEQLVVVTGEEDNVLEPLPALPKVVSISDPPSWSPPVSSAEEMPTGMAPPKSPPPPASSAEQGGCSVGRSLCPASATEGALLLALGLLACRRRTSSKHRAH